MKSKEKTAIGAVAVLLLLLLTGVSFAQVAGPDAMRKGVEFARLKVI